MGGGLCALQDFSQLKRAVEFSIFLWNEPYKKILGPLGRYDDPKKKNTCIRDLSSGKNKKYKIPHFCR